MYQLAASGIIHQILARKKKLGLLLSFPLRKIPDFGVNSPRRGQQKKKPLHEMNETGKKKK